MFFEADRALRLVAIVKNNGNTGFRNACLAALVDQVLIPLSAIVATITTYLTCLQILRSHHAQVIDSEDKTYGIEDVGLSGSVESGNRVEAFVPNLE